MKLISFSPTTPARRHSRLIKSIFRLSLKSPLKSAVKRLKKHAGRNHQGLLTIGSKGGGHKKRYRNIISKLFIKKALVEQIEYDPYRSAFIARMFDFANKKHVYILAPQNLKPGDLVLNEPGFMNIGSQQTLANIPVGSRIHNLFLTKTFPACRAAGTFSRILKKSDSFVSVSLPSGETRLVSSNSFATIGMVSNELYRYVKIGKAGRSRWLNQRPQVRGVAMNPIDHGHGGGEGKTSGGRVSVTPWGKPAHNVPTSRSKTKLVLVSRKKK